MNARTKVHDMARIVRKQLRGKTPDQAGESPEYRTWKAMKSRCLNPNTVQYRNYGGRGITICERWRNSFSAFLSDMGNRPSPAHSIDRINNDGPYAPRNCRWATRREQNANKSCNKRVTFRGETKPLFVWCAELGIDRNVVRQRLDKLRWDAERALTTPSQPNALKTHCKHGHPFTPENTIRRSRRTGGRICRTCDNANQREHWPAKAAKRKGASR